MELNSEFVIYRIQSLRFQIKTLFILKTRILYNSELVHPSPIFEEINYLLVIIIHNSNSDCASRTFRIVLKKHFLLNYERAHMKT